MRNEATRYLATKSLADFEFVGVAERFAESLHVCARIFEWPVRVLARRDHVNPARLTPTYELSPSDFNYILALNGADLTAYEHATVRLDQALRRELTRVA